MEFCPISYTPLWFSTFVANSLFEKTKPILSFGVLRSEFCIKSKKTNLKKQSQFQDAGSDSAMEFEEKCLQHVLKMQKT